MTLSQIACAQTYMWENSVVALQQQCAQLSPAETLKPVLLQHHYVVRGVQVVGEATSSPATDTKHVKSVTMNKCTSMMQCLKNCKVLQVNRTLVCWALKCHWSSL